MPERRHDLLERLAEADSFAQRPGNFADRPEDRMEALSEILSRVKLNGVLFFSAELSAPWGFSAPASKYAGGAARPGRGTSCPLPPTRAFSSAFSTKPTNYPASAPGNRPSSMNSAFSWERSS
jgi:hypothetical protein